MIDETLHLLEDTVARNKRRMIEIEQALTFAGEAASLFVDVHRLIDDDIQIMEEVSRMWAYAASRVRDILGGDDEALLHNGDIIEQAETVLRLNEVVMKDMAEKLERNSEQARILHEALMRLEQAVANAKKGTMAGEVVPTQSKES